ncbi:hypothetical protein LP420_22350 [Massilia sp. B-10]|nr:hypothetical protein LP420_22350 [Massilia sp. B-10]
MTPTTVNLLTGCKLVEVVQLAQLEQVLHDWPDDLGGHEWVAAETGLNDIEDVLAIPQKRVTTYKIGAMKNEPFHYLSGKIIACTSAT